MRLKTHKDGNKKLKADALYIPKGFSTLISDNNEVRHHVSYNVFILPCLFSLQSSAMISNLEHRQKSQAEIIKELH